jgi:hypothetical protein
VLGPDGNTYANAPAIIYARAIDVRAYNAALRANSTLSGVITDDVENFEDNGATAMDAPPLKTADGQQLKVVTFRKTDHVESVAYGQEGGYYLMFVLSANFEGAYNKTLPVFRELISRYRK